MFKKDFIIENWLYNPKQDEIFLTGRTKGWFSYRKAECSYRPSNHSASGSKFLRGLNMLGEYEHFQTKNWTH